MAASDLGCSQPVGDLTATSSSIAAAQASPSAPSGAGDTGSLCDVSQPASSRDTAVEDELFRSGAFSDVVFRFRGGPGTTTEGDESYPCYVYGQRAMFALFSPVLRETLLRPVPVSPDSSSLSGRVNDASASSIREASEEAQSRDSKTEDGYAPSSLGGVEEVWLEEAVTAAAFREVARYVYKLPMRLHVTLLPEMLSAAQALVIPELEALAYGFGMRHIGTSSCSVGIALMCLERLRTVGSREFAASWQRALLRSYPTSEVLRSNVFQDLSLVTLQGLLRSCSVHEDENKLWAACLTWAKAQAAREPAKAPATRPPLAPRKLFGRAAQPIIGKPADSSDREGVAKWQRWLLPLAPGFRFALMSDKDFATNVQGVHVVLPELRSAIYASRRRDVRTFSS
jgi:hypothetical protein